MVEKRKFTDEPAVRSAVPLLVGLAGPSGSGKTFSALRLATGMQRVTGGDIFVVDTEARRALHYADDFKFRHVEFKAPFNPLDYLAAIQHCVEQGAQIIVVDSMSHEHEGPGGVLEMHAAEVERMAGGDARKAERVKMAAWIKPKQARRRLLNSMVQTGASLICCFRAKDKIKLVTGKDPVQLGWMPIAGDEFVYEMTTSILLPAGARGVPEWKPEHVGERMMTKLPAQFSWLAKSKCELDEAVGERMAIWAAGSSPEDDALVRDIQAAPTRADLEALAPRLKEGANLSALRTAYAVRLRALPKEGAAAVSSHDDGPGRDDGPPSDWTPGSSPTDDHHQG